MNISSPMNFTTSTPRHGNMSTPTDSPFVFSSKKTIITTPSSPKVDKEQAAQQYEKIILGCKTTFFKHKKLDPRKSLFLLEKEKRSQFYMDLVWYLIFLIVLFIFIAELPVHILNEQNLMSYNTFVKQNIQDMVHEKFFDEITLKFEYENWINSTLYFGIFDWDYTNVKFIGPIRFRQMRSKEIDCEKKPISKDTTCLSHISGPDDQDRQPFGPGNKYKWYDDNNKLYSTIFASSNRFSLIQNLGRGGYRIDISPDDEVKGREQLNEIINTFFTDRTAIMETSFLQYSTASQLWTNTRLLLEISNTYNYKASYKIRTGKFMLMRNFGDLFSDYIEIPLLVILLICLLIRESREFFSSPVDYFKSAWNWLEVTQILLIFILLIFWSLYVSQCHKLVRSIDDDITQFHQTDDLIYYWTTLYNIASFSALFSPIKVFKYLRLSSRLNLIWHAISLAAVDLIAFIVIFMIIFFGFMFTGNIAFGAKSENFQSIFTSFLACFNMMMGDSDRLELVKANPMLGTVFYFIYLLFVSIILVNVFIAILNEFFTESQEENERRQKLKKKLLSKSGGNGNGNNGNDDNGNGKKDNKTDEKEVENTEDELSFMVEYDIFERLSEYINGFNVIVTPPLDTLRGKATIALKDSNIVEIVDEKWLKAERKRLHRIYKNAIHLSKALASQITIEYTQAQAKNRKDIKFNKKKLGIPKKLVTVQSTSYNACQLLSYVKDGSQVRIDDNSLSKKPVELSCIGKFDFHGYNEGIGSGDHVKQYLVTQGSVLVGGEKLVFKWSVILRYFWWDFYNSIWEIVKAICKWRPFQHKGGLLNDYEIQKIFEGVLKSRYEDEDEINNLKNSKDGNNNDDEREKEKENKLVVLRYDELLKIVRYLLLKKIGVKNKKGEKIDDLAHQETISLLSRFQEALTEGSNFWYDEENLPSPVDTSKVRLPLTLNKLIDFLSENNHMAWARSKIDDGWRYGPTKDAKRKRHPDLVPYGQLSDASRKFNKDAVSDTLKVILALGWRMDNVYLLSEGIPWKFFNPPKTAGGTFEPKPFNSSRSILSPTLNELVEMLAENTHEMWAKIRMEEGYKFGRKDDENKKILTSLLPYFFLLEEDKEKNRVSARELVKVITSMGIVFIEPKVKLFVKHVPEILKDEAVQELFIHYGAIDVKRMNNIGVVFLEFSNKEEAEKAIQQLNGLKLVEKQLVAEFVKEKEAIIEDKNESRKENEDHKEHLESIEIQESTQKVHPLFQPTSISPKLGINYPFPPHLHYKYPVIDQNIASNITNTVPQFYNQVLHLMNKMNLPPPFGVLRTNLPYPECNIIYRKAPKRLQDELLASDESELDSEEENNGRNYHHKRFKPNPNENMIKSPIQQPPIQTPPPPPTVIPTTSIDIPQHPSSLLSTNSLFSLPNNNKIPSANSSMFVVDDKDRNMLMESDILRNRMSEEDILKNEKFQNYKPGDPSNTIYLKNLSNKVTEEDLKLIYGFVFESDEETNQQLQINLMKRGRMRGQAFITFPSVRQASQAMSITHGYMLYEQPMIVAFGKMKTKEDNQNVGNQGVSRDNMNNSNINTEEPPPPQPVMKQNKETNENNNIEEEEDDDE